MFQIEKKVMDILYPTLQRKFVGTRYLLKHFNVIIQKYNISISLLLSNFYKF